MDQEVLHTKILTYEQAIIDILNMIRKEGLKTGDRLPSERELAGRLGVSRPCLREALHVMAGNGMLKIRPKSGAYVNVLENGLKDLGIGRGTGKNTLPDIKKLLEIRMLVEPYAFIRASKAMTPEQIRQIGMYEEEIFESMMEESLNGKEPFGKPTIGFEHMIVQMQENQMLTDLHRRLCAMWLDFLETSRIVTMLPMQRHREHMAILNAIRDKSEAQIHKSTAVHLGNTHKRIDSLIAKMQEGQETDA